MIYQPKPIDSFDGRYSFLSNFYDAPVTYKGITYLNSEAAYQAQKDPKQAYAFKHLPANKAKRLSHKMDVVENWDDIKYGHMLEIVRQKFRQNPNLARHLLHTGHRELIEGNWWNDTYWGVCDGKGENNLGKILMQVRRELKPYIIGR